MWQNRLEEPLSQVSKKILSKSPQKEDWNLGTSLKIRKWNCLGSYSLSRIAVEFGDEGHARAAEFDIQ
jgi:hypothetical protein